MIAQAADVSRAGSLADHYWYVIRKSLPAAPLSRPEKTRVESLL
jgi:hypothetical protein